MSVPRQRRAAGLLVVAAALVGLAGCGGSSDTAGSVAKGPSGKIVVLAASSLTESFTALGKAFEAEHPGTTVSFSFAASSELATQGQQGAPADVFASASPATMAQVSDGGDTAVKPVTFARNTLEIAVPAGNPATNPTRTPPTMALGVVPMTAVCRFSAK